MATVSERAADAKLDDLAGLTSATLLLREELRADRMRELEAFELGSRRVQIAEGRDAVWVIVRRRGRGGLAMRAAFCPGGCIKTRVARAGIGPAVTVEAESTIGRHFVTVVPHEEDAIPVLRVTTQLAPAVPLLPMFVPRDLYVLDAEDDPAGARGEVEAAQRGFNSGAVYFRIDEPDFGSVLYFQDLTRLNPYFRATDTKPDGAVGGKWPELGFLLPPPPLKGEPSPKPIPAGEKMVVSDAYLAFHDASAADECEMARRYLALLGAVLRRLELPPTEFRDWVDRAERSLKDLTNSPKATIEHYGHRYIHPYTAAEYPDSMVQLSVLASLRDYAAWKREEFAIAGELAAGLGKFYDPKLGTLRRYLPNVGKEKDRNAVDSWYLYHPLMSLGRLATDGDKRARALFLKSIGFGIRAAHHFEYKWPIQYDVRDFSVIQESRDDQGLGQTDVGGIYAYVMLLGFELTDDKKYLDEARKAIDAARGMRFELNYQANLTAWGAAACLRLWRITNEETYLFQSYVYLASFFHNTAMWESEFGHARNYRNFLGVTALHDAPYMAMYECFDSFAAFERYLKDSGPDVDASVRLLLTQYCRYALDRAWFYYPDALPEEAIAPKQREPNGHVDRKLSFPVEDLYVDGQQAGQVGQEIYGAGAAFVFASRTFHSVRDAPFRIFCDHFMLASERPAERALSFQLAGVEGFDAAMSLVRTGRARLPGFVVTTADGRQVKPCRQDDDRVEYHVPADGRITIAWNR